MTTMNRDMEIIIRNLTTSEVNTLIYGNADPDEPVEMPAWIAEQVAMCQHFDSSLLDWAFHTLDAEVA